MTSIKRLKPIIISLALLGIFGLGLASGYFYFNNIKSSNQAEEDIYLKFAVEVYDKIKENYWEKINDEQIVKLFQLGIEKILAMPQNPESNDKKGLEKMLSKAMEGMDEQKKKEFVVGLSDIVLANLQPFGRNRLFSQKQKEELSNLVNNIDSETDLYEILGVSKTAAQKEIKTAYEEKKKSLAGQTAPEAKERLAAIQRAYDALASQESKENYDQLKVEPTVVSKILHPKIFYIRIKRFSPTTLDEFQKAANSVASNNDIDSMILDLRSNIGGAIDILPYFLGPFIGPNQYAYEFYKKGENMPFKTKTGWLESLVKYKKIVILINGETQSSGEVVAATLKKYNVGVLVGVPTKGWGTVENIFPLETRIDPNENYSASIVHSVTLREDGQPIEGRGVEPVIDVRKKDWGRELLSYFNFKSLVEEIEKLIEN